MSKGSGEKTKSLLLCWEGRSIVLPFSISSIIHPWMDGQTVYGLLRMLVICLSFLLIPSALFSSSAHGCRKGFFSLHTLIEMAMQISGPQVRATDNTGGKLGTHNIFYHDEEEIGTTQEESKRKRITKSYTKVPTRALGSLVCSITIVCASNG